MKNELSFVLFSRKRITFQVAREQIKFLTTFDDGLMLPDRCSDTEPVRSPFVEQNLESYALRLATPHGRFFYKKGSPAFVRGEMWNLTHSKDATFPSPLFCSRWTGRLNDKWAQKTGFDKLETFIENIFYLTESDFALFTPTDDLEAKNKANEILSFKGFDIQKGVPGLYWWNFFSKSLADHLKLATFSSEFDVFSKLSDGGVFIKFGENPEESRTPNILQRQKSAIKRIGAKYFFDIKSPDRLLQTLYL